MKTIAVVGLGYVGLPLAVELGKVYNVIGYDIDDIRVKELSDGFDRTCECTNEQIQLSANLKFTSCLEEIKRASIYIVTSPPCR